MTTDTPTPSDQLHALYQLSDRVVPGGFAWPEELDFSHFEDGVFYLGVQMRGQSLYIDEMDDPNNPWWSHALAIVERAAEDWLRGRGWTWVSMPGSRYEGMQWWALGHNHGRYTADSLPAALAAENGRGG